MVRKLFAFAAVLLVSHCFWLRHVDAMRPSEPQETSSVTKRTDRYRLIQWRDFATGEIVEHELYDHQTPSLETRNLAKTAPAELMDSLKQQLLASHPPKKLVMTPAVHSSPSVGRWPAKLSFQNEADSEIMIYPITPEGSRGKVRKVPPKGNAQIGGAFVVESVDGSVYEIHSPSWPEHAVTIRSSSK